MDTIARIFCILLHFCLTKNENLPLKVVFPPSELSSSRLLSTSNSSLKLALRYGFHQTSECKVFEKTFLCMQKCIDLHYDVAFSDKYCFCTCYKNKEKAIYSNKLSNNSTKWKYGAPTTSKPAWAQKYSTSKETTTVDSTDQEMETNTSSISDFTEVIVVNDTLISSTANPSHFTDVLNETLPDNNTTRAENTELVLSTSPTTVSDVDYTNSSNVTVAA